MFKVGDNIVYPMHGAGKVEKIEEKEILGEKQKYYVISLPGEVKAMVPAKNAEKMGVREIIGKDGVNKVFEVLEHDETEMSDNWNKRYKENLDKIKTGDVYQVADVVRNLSFKQKEKGTLSTGEKKMLNNAKLILVSELSLAENAPENEIEKVIDSKIDMSFNEYKMPDKAEINMQKMAVNKFIPFNEN